MPFIKTTAGRTLLGVAYLISANALSGLFAVLLDYPSLWGKSTGIFGEYAIPLPFTWALAHWISMLPFTLVMLGMPLWEKRSVIRIRWLLLAGILVSLFFEIDLPYGRLEHNPFLLFLTVDFVLVLLLSFLFYTSVKVQLAGLVTLVTLILGIIFQEPLVRFSSLQGPLLSELEVEISHKEKLVRYHFNVIPALTPGESPYPDKICAAAEKLFDEVTSANPAPADYTEIVLFWARPKNAKPGTTYPAGSAGQDHQRHWICDLNYPSDN